MDAYHVFAGIGWSLADGYGPLLDLNVPGAFVARGFLGLHRILPTVEVNLSFTGVSP